jgi:hypothetical protein
VEAAAGDPQSEVLLAELRRSHESLVNSLSGLSDEQVAGPSYADEWSIGQVASHLGSGAEIFGLFLAAGRQHSPAPGAGEFEPIWSRWNAKSPIEQSRDVVPADAEFLAAVDALTPEERAAWSLDMFGTDTATEPVETAASLRLPAEAFVRLVYGRLDADHTPESVAAEDIDLDDLRAAFPGF